MRQETIDTIHKRIDDTQENRARTRDLVDAGNWRDAEDDSTRGEAFDARVKRISGSAEAIHGTNDFQPASFLFDGANARKAVARVAVQTPQASSSGSGFLISPQLFITNQHVINNADDAKCANLIFDDELDNRGISRQRTIFRLAPEKLAIFSDENDLDYAVIAIGERLQGTGELDDFGYCPLSFSPDRHRKGINVNIIQHPNGMPKTIAVRNNLLTDRTETRLLYETDTDFGSSGSPVFNDQWDVVALHHYGAPSSAQATDNGGDNAAKVNEGIRISAIYKDLETRMADLNAEQKSLIEKTLALWSSSAPVLKQLEHRPANLAVHTPTESAISLNTIQPMEAIMRASDSHSMSMTFPIQISVKIGTPTMSDQQEVAPEVSRSSVKLDAMPQLKKLSEASKLDTDYSNRNGFDPKFVAGVEIDIAQITTPKRQQIAPLHQGEEVGAHGELRYQNFSVVMHKTRRVAMLTATNIDGETYITIDRKTGLPSAHQPEGETWYLDSRISSSYVIDQDFYSRWSHLFDRGHLTRRNDPTWGQFATRANNDTFHFTNCSPQHWLFNESQKFWQGIERYVLEQGLFESGRDKPISVLQGPVFNNTDDLWADEVQVPSAFWKIVIWNSAGALKAVALVANQTALFSQVRRGVAPPAGDTPVNVTQWRSSIAAIEKMTGLDFSAIKPYDTADQSLPTVGEALQLITRWEDIKLSKA